MPQTLLPLFPSGAIPINEVIWYEKSGGQVYYFHGGLPIFSHGEQDSVSFRLITSQLVEMGNCKQAEIIKAFGVSSISVKRYVKKYRNGGAAAFFEKPATRKPRVFTPGTLIQAQQLLADGHSAPDVAQSIGVKLDTLQKAIRAGRLVVGEKKRSL